MNTTTVWTFFAALALLLLSGCDDARPMPLPPVQVRTITVDRPVPVPCVDAADIPTMPAKVGDQLNGDAGHDLGVVASSALRLRTALDEALALLGACVR